jgi:hypothetical protein
MKAVRVIAIIVIAGGGVLGVLGLLATFTIRNYPVSSLFVPLGDVLIGVFLLVVSNVQLKKRRITAGESTEHAPV